ncbi:BTAD domain-containing putative transcriptional regulator [Streptomyces sp. NPDC047072]|uniref:AfsR/SARP family transcriptional regulator n=1 Tax=Streptomyces sp. NPDC047072 TaxID=3154809 RepID=UPI0034013810
MTPHIDPLRFAVLGSVRAWRGEREVELGPPQQRAMLAALLVRRGRPATVAELLDAVWGEKPPTAAVSVLRTYASRLRKVLEVAEATRVLVSIADGYAIRVEEDDLDLAVFERLVARARTARAAGDAGAVADLLHSALDTWRGEALAGIPGPLAEFERARLREMRLAALETRLEADVELGRHTEVIAELLSLTATHPLREPLCRLLMLALYRADRQAEALAAYRRTRDTLAGELGVEPGLELRELHERILAGDPVPGLWSVAEPVEGPRTSGGFPADRASSEDGAALAGGVPETGDRVPVGLRAARPSVPVDQVHPATVAEASRAGGQGDAPAPAAAVPHSGGDADVPVARPTPRLAQLPADLPAFVGREEELDRVRALLPADGGAPPAVLICAIGGMGGVGKTALAVHWAHEIADRFPDGQLYINLRGFDPSGTVVTPEEAIRVFLDALGVPPMRLPAGLDAQAALYRSLLHRRRMLVLLDNARDTEQIRPLLPGTPGCLVVVTSRNQLTGLVAGEGAQPLTLGQLNAVEARELLVRRLGAERPDAEPEAVAEIVERCARLPLALAIVAAQAAAQPAFPLAAIAEELRECHGSLDAFAGGDDLGTDVRAVFSWSYRALSPPAARLFRIIGLHDGVDLSVHGAAALTGITPREARSLLGELSRAHLVVEHFRGRYTRHDLIRVYGAERAAAEEPQESVARADERLLAWYTHTADAAYTHITPSRRRIPLEPVPEGCSPLEFGTYEEAVRWCETERPNLVCAAHHAAVHGQTAYAWRLPAVLWGFFYLRSHIREWLVMASEGLTAARAGHDARGVAQGLADTAAALRASGRYEEAVDHLREAMTAWRNLGDEDGRAAAVGNLGDVYLQAGMLDKAVEYVRRSLALDRARGDVWGQGIALSNLGDAYQRLGRFDEAVACLEEALTVLREIGNRWVEGVTLDILGRAHGRLGRYGEAVSYFDHALKTHRDVGNRWGEGHTLGNLGDVQLASGERESARSSWEQALELFAEFEHPDAGRIRDRLNGL